MTLNADGDAIGYVTGVIDDLAHSTYMKHTHGRTLGFAGLTALAGRPRLWIPTLRTRARPYLRFLLRPRPSVKGSARLDYVFVEETVRSAGSGAALVGTFVNTLELTGTHVITLVARASSEDATRFWAHLGWRQAGTTRTHDGDQLVIFRMGREVP
jgi:GNAT superfamily N-acetyltransferase